MLFNKVKRTNIKLLKEPKNTFITEKINLMAAISNKVVYLHSFLSLALHKIFI